MPVNPKTIVARTLTTAALVAICAVSLIAPGAVHAQEPAEPEPVVQARAMFERAIKFAGDGKFRDALAPAEEAVVLFEKAFGPDHRELIQPLLLVGNMRRETGDLKGTEKANLRALAIAEKELGEENEETATVLNNLGVIYRLLGVFSKARPYYERALAIRKKILGPDAFHTAESHTNLGILLREVGDYAAAGVELQRGFDISIKMNGLDHVATGVSFGMLAALKNSTGKYAEAERLHLKAYEIHERVAGSENRLTLTSLNNLANFYTMVGAFDKAEPLLTKALETRERVYGPDHPDTLSSVGNLASLYLVKGDTKRARPLFERLQEACNRVYVSDSEVVSRAYGYMASLEMAEGRIELAEVNYRKALAAREAQLGPDHPKTADSLAAVGAILLARGEDNEAWPYLERAYAIDERTLGSDHPSTISALRKKGEYYWAKGKIAEAVDAIRLAEDARERDLNRNLAVGSEQRKLSYLELTANELDRTISLHQTAAPGNILAAEAALEIILRRKGRALDAMTGQIESLRRRASPEDQALLNDLALAQAEYARLALASPKPGEQWTIRLQLNKLAARVEQLESQAAERSAEFRATTLSVSLAGVREGIPENTTLVEFTAYAPYDPKTRQSGPRRYTAYTLEASGGVKCVDLGLVSEIDPLVEAFRRRLGSPAGERGLRAAGRALDEHLMRPVRAIVGEASGRLLIAPDGVLNLVPFAALVDESGRYLVESREIVYLSSGRELLRLRPGAPGLRGRAAEIVANPDFGETKDASAGPMVFRPLPGTALEAKAIARLLPSSTVLTGPSATEAAIKRTDAPPILHIATHGFYLDAEPEPPEAVAARKLWESTRDVVQVSAQQASAPGTVLASARDPLLRTGLGLSGANVRHADEEDDGLLTALEAASLNLWGTELVVLSACDTGVGEVSAGNGVYSLRRALTIAGAEAQLTSLWPVSDRGTRELMVAYYGELLAGRGRSEALRVTQLAMLRDPRRRHPFYWAGFVPSGAWWPLSSVGPAGKQAARQPD